MAIDTALKRGSVIGLKLPFRMTLPFPSGSIGAPQRGFIGGPAYAGIPFSPPTPPPSNTAIILGLTMVAQGLTILSGLTTNLYKGLVEDELNNIPK